MEWEFWIERKYVPFALSLNCFTNSLSQLDRVFSCPVQDAFLYHADMCYFPAGDKKTIGQKQLSLGIPFLWEMGRRCEQDGEKLLSQIKELALGDDLQKMFSSCVQEYIKYVVYFSYGLSLEDFFTKELTERVKKYTQEDIVADLCVSVREQAHARELRSLYAIASAYQKKESVDSLVAHHCKQFSWMQMRWFVGTPYTEKEILARATAVENPEEKLSELGIEDESEEIFSRYGFSEDDKDFVRLVQYHIFLRTYKADVLSEACYVFYLLLQKISDKYCVAYDDLLYLSWQEIELLFQKGSTAVAIASRKENWALIREKDVVSIFSGDEVGGLLQREGIGFSYQERTVLQGKTAFSGSATGRAKIVKSASDIAKVEKGDILVAVMTFPNFLPAMEKAVAFVTNDGGILSHASIIAREMKKPCVIGTKYATHVFSDGDLLEVDAEQGVVRKIE